MEHNKSAAGWIEAYLEWTDAGGYSGIEEAVAGAGEEYLAAYFEWLDAVQSASEYKSEALREAILLMALRAESDCMHILRQALEDGAGTRDTAELPFEALEIVAADARALASKVLALQAH